MSLCTQPFNTSVQILHGGNRWNACLELIALYSPIGIYEQDLKGLRSRQAKAMLAAVKENIEKNYNLDQHNKNGVALVCCFVMCLHLC